jgi:imidazole glycerol-phosphate synthase subunit HisH
VKSVVIVDSGGANLASLVFALQRLGAECEVTRDIATIKAAPRLILPGVGAAGDAMQRLEKAGLIPVLPQLTQPVLGICLGMQLLFARTAEDDVNGLNLIPDNVFKLQSSASHPVPHMGWNTVNFLRDHPLLAEIETDTFFYFVHSYAAAQGTFTLARTTYNVEFSAVVARANFMGTQFHPERSGPAGALILKNFLRL